MATPVIFKLEKNSFSPDSVVAFFPAEAATLNPYECTCYAHIGQHGAACVSYAAALRPATPEQYAPLMRELERRGYADLKPVRKFLNAHTAARRAQIAKLAA